MRRILDMLFPPREDEVTLRGVCADEFIALISPRLVPQTIPGAVALLPFSHPSVRAAIHEAKYHGNEHAFRFLSLTLAEYLRDTDVRFTKPHIMIMPVPLGRARRKERGFNQTEEVVKRAFRHLGEEYSRQFVLKPNLLVRVRETVSQVSLPRHEREENMRGAFGAAHSIDPTHTYLIIDDVLTTGATLQAAVDAIRSAGAAHILPLALAH